MVIVIVIVITTTVVLAVYYCSSTVVSTIIMTIMGTTQTHPTPTTARLINMCYRVNQVKGHI